MRRVQRSSILSNVSLKASKLENNLINAIDNRSKAERREQQAPRKISELNYHTTLVWNAKPKQTVHSWTF